MASAEEVSVFGKHTKKAQDAMHARDFSAALVEWKKAKELLTGTQGVPTRLWFEIGRCHRGLREHRKAIDCFKRAVAANSFEQGSYIWRSKLKMALSLHDLGQRKEAQDLLRLCETELDAMRGNDTSAPARRRDLQTTRKIIRETPKTKK